MSISQSLIQSLQTRFGQEALNIEEDLSEVTIEVPSETILDTFKFLKSDEACHFEELIDLCGVDYLHYGLDEWTTSKATSTGYERGVRPIQETNDKWNKPRFAVVYHLLSIKNNHRLRVRAFVNDENPIIHSIVSIYSCADWYEREAFDLYGILFEGHPDLRRILTDYGFIGHPFRKDFPLVGQVEVRYDAKQERVIYEPVDITPRTLVPKTIRHISRADIQAETKSKE